MSLLTCRAAGATCWDKAAHQLPAPACATCAAHHCGVCPDGYPTPAVHSRPRPGESTCPYGHLAGLHCLQHCQHRLSASSPLVYLCGFGGLCVPWQQTNPKEPVKTFYPEKEGCLYCENEHVRFRRIMSSNMCTICCIRD